MCFQSNIYICVQFACTMTEKDKNLLDTFEGKVRHLVFLYDKLKEENESLKQTLAEKDNEMSAMKQELSELESKYKNLKMARMFSVNIDEIRDAKKELSDLVREVDKCIALLNE